MSDLLLVDGLLRCDAPPSKLTLHLKDRPVFVSDVTEPDLEPTFAWMAARGGAPMVERLRAALADGRLGVEAPP